MPLHRHHHDDSFQLDLRREWGYILGGDGRDSGTPGPGNNICVSQPPLGSGPKGPPFESVGSVNTMSGDDGASEGGLLMGLDVTVCAD